MYLSAWQRWYRFLPQDNRKAGVLVYLHHWRDGCLQCCTPSHSRCSNPTVWQDLRRWYIPVGVTEMWRVIVLWRSFSAQMSLNSKLRSFCTLKRRLTTPSSTSHLVFPLTPMQPSKNWEGLHSCQKQHKERLEATLMRSLGYFCWNVLTCTSFHSGSFSRLTTTFTCCPSFQELPSPLSSSNISKSQQRISTVYNNARFLWKIPHFLKLKSL